MTSTLGIKKIQYPNGTNIVTLDSSGSIAFAGASTVGGTLGVTGTATLSGNATIGTNSGDTRFHFNSANKYTTKFSNAGNVAGHLGGNGADDLRFTNAAGADTIKIKDGRITMPLQTAFMAQPASTQTNLAVAGSGVDIALGTERFDVGGNFASNTFTAPVTGKYALHALFYMNAVDSGTTYYEFTIKTSNRNYGLVVYVGAGGSTDHAYATWSSSVIADMDASDTAHLHFYQAGGTQQTDVSTGTYFMGYLLG